MTDEPHASLSCVSRRRYRERSVATYRNPPADPKPCRPRLLPSTAERPSECLRPTLETHRVETAVADLRGSIGTRGPTDCFTDPEGSNRAQRALEERPQNRAVEMARRRRVSVGGVPVRRLQRQSYDGPQRRVRDAHSLENRHDTDSRSPRPTGHRERQTRRSQEGTDGHMVRLLRGRSRTTREVRPDGYRPHRLYRRGPRYPVVHSHIREPFSRVFVPLRRVRTVCPRTTVPRTEATRVKKLGGTTPESSPDQTTNPAECTRLPTQASTWLVKEYDVVAVEDLDAKPMLETSHSAKNKQDAAWSRFLDMLEYIGDLYGTHVVRVDARGTTKACNECSVETSKPLWVRSIRAQHAGPPRTAI